MERTDKQENMCGGDDRQEFSAACQLCVSRQEVSVLLISDSVECENRCLLLYECELIICVDADDKFTLVEQKASVFTLYAVTDEEYRNFLS